MLTNRRDVRIVYLKGEPELIARRMAVRHDHFMPPSLLDSQFAALEEPGEDEGAIRIEIGATPAQLASQIIAALQLQPAVNR